MARDRIMSLKEVSDSLGRSPRTIWRWWAKDKCFPWKIFYSFHVKYFLSAMENIFLSALCPVRGCDDRLLVREGATQ